MKTYAKTAAEIESGDVLFPTITEGLGEIVWAEPYNGGIRALVATDSGKYTREFYRSQLVTLIETED